MERERKSDWRQSMERVRVLMLGCASACAAVLFVVLQEPGLRAIGALPVTFASIGIPISLVSAFMAEAYVESEILEYPRRSVPATAMAMMFICVGVVATAAVWSLLDLFFPTQGWIFGWLCILSFFGVLVFSVLVDREQARGVKGPGDQES